MPQEPDQTKWYQIGALAKNLGFESDEINRLISLDPDREIAREALVKARDPKNFKYDESAFDGYITQISSIFKSATDKPSMYVKPTLLVDGRGEGLERRCGRAFKRAYNDNQEYLFLENLYNQREGEGRGTPGR